MLNERNIPLEEDGIEEEILVDEEVAITKAMWGDIQGNIENQTDLQNALDAKQDSLTEAQLNAVNSGITAEKVTTYDGYADQIASKADQSALNAESIARGEADTALGTRIDNEALARQNADNGLQSQIDAITSKSDVVDVVANYAALQAYDTSSLGNNDVIKVLDDETHEDALTYYRWSTTTQTWTYIGQEAPYYSKGQMDVMLQGKQDKLTAGANIQIENGAISATDTTYTAGNGLNLNGTEFSADTTVLATKEDLENYYTKPEADNLLAPKLEAEVMAELPTTGEEGKLYLTPKAHTTQTATGNPITATVAEEAGALESFQLDGDTFQQSYEGKNLFNKANVVQGIPSASDGSIVSTTSVGRTSGFIEVSGGVTYTTSGRANGWATNAYYTTDKTFISRVDNQATIITPSNCAFMRVSCNSADLDVCQLELGSTATDYEPYVGGVPSPNPDYPQAIQTVTGVQTVSINGTDYPIDLGSIELNGLGDDGNGNPLYKDYIWKDGEDWKVHKATGEVVLTGAENWQYPDIGSAATFFQLSNNNWDARFGADTHPIGTGGGAIQPTSAFLANKLKSIAGSDANMRLNQGVGKQGTWFRIALLNTLGISTLAQFETWLSTNNVEVAYALATSTDTTITDTTLIAQLEAIRTALLQNGANTITNTATDSNLAGDMEIGYYGYNPTNRYDKFIWLDINDNYEQIGE